MPLYEVCIIQVSSGDNEDIQSKSLKKGRESKRQLLIESFSEMGSRCFCQGTCKSRFKLTLERAKRWYKC